MVNLAGVLKDERVLDPFCGTGTILIEVDLVGARALGIDFSGDIVAGAARNLRALGCTADLVRADALLAPRFLRERFDHIVTDPPYGRASPSSREHRFLLHRLPAVCSALLKKGGTACFASPSTIDLHDEASRASLEVLEFAYQRVHGSLGRHLYLTKKL
jgi:tRNA (guanine10-N2)-dimethyltransferase